METYIIFIKEEEGIIGKVGVYAMFIESNKSGGKYAEDWLPVKNILNGMIQLENGFYVTGIKVIPKNIFILDPQERENVLFNLRNFYNIIDYEFWLIVADRPVDINAYLAHLQMNYNTAKTAAARKIIMQDINKANAFMGAEYNVIDTEYFILFKEKKLEIIQKKLHNLIANLANAGINSMQVSNSDLRMILDNFLNGGATTNFGTVMS